MVREVSQRKWFPTGWMCVRNKGRVLKVLEREKESKGREIQIVGFRRRKELIKER